MFMVLLFCPVSWLTDPDFSRLAEEMASDGIRPGREPYGFGSELGTFLKYLHSAILCTGRANYVNIRIAWWWINFRRKLISRMNAKSRNRRPAKYKRFTVYIWTGVGHSVHVIIFGSLCITRTDKNHWHEKGSMKKAAPSTNDNVAKVLFCARWVQSGSLSHGPVPRIRIGAFFP